ncbi:histidine phosphatase family protein [Anaerosporobacter sp.]|uniref:histidine phosphatase family protein n=1 Tax=Anaerosporobacter sp. TaxID=1872529 RepID=UPI00286F7689|nr:histidine phosphatase family protein [Anaerosporobacter sp.]
MKIYLVRHGETDWNIERRFQGLEDIPLNETGKKQAKECAQALTSTSFEAIYSSPLQRAYDTATIIADTINAFHMEQGTQEAVLAVQKDSRLLERDFGKISGLLPDDRKAFLASGEDACMEEFEHLTNRLIEALEEYRREYQGQNILVIAHGGVINAILHVFSNGEIGTGKTLVANTSVAILEDSEGVLKIETYNKHL